MTDALEFYGICICMIILTIFFLSTPYCVFSSHRPITHQTPAAVHGLLHSPTVSTDTLLRSRASANARLSRVFRLSNSLVDPNLAVHAVFLRQCRALLQAAGCWMHFSGVALQAVELALLGITTPFHVFVRAVTLCTVIGGLLDPHTSSASNNIDIVMSRITCLRLLSRNPEPIPEHLLAVLNASLRRLLPDIEKYPNPLDFVIPVCAALWRVVAVTIAHVHEDAAACEAFRDFSANPNILPVFHAPRRGGTSPSVENYINESLRLHPPIRHITRHIFKPSMLTPFLPGILATRIPPRINTEFADIESAQRSAFRSSGSPPEAYDAARFLHSPRVSDVLAFGHGPLKCTAANWAPTAAAVIVGAILNRVNGVTYQIVRGGRVGGREGWDGWMVRKLA
ncbi:hypothetical protein C8F04DRAFT_1077884 [Mycena alexandri]|uniref:Cytochrome P450 n=1 Tax=Mycena alexandri TaxID=1745969 RepID=A0AAD6TAD4_9AGAR|nr:hypothetical protein C8F04DRAFT_1077884 [Mycena alexandri]